MDGDNYKKYCDPGQANIIKRYCALKRVSTELSAVGVVLIPVNAAFIRWTI